jgi:AAA+ superfamily predicted ATPase
MQREREKDREAELFGDALARPPNAVAYETRRALTEIFPGKSILESDDRDFDVRAFGAAGLASVEVRRSPLGEVVTRWRGPRKGCSESIELVMLGVVWQGHRLSVVVLSYVNGFNSRRRQFVVGDTDSITTAFFQSVRQWCHQPRGEVLVFQEGYWRKSRELFESISRTTFDDLILTPALKVEIQRDITQFMASRDSYERYRVPWKRGILFVGPAGNGKTHCVKASINLIKVPCLYVQSFTSRWDTNQSNIEAVFDRAREQTPCCLVLEDLDALVNNDNRSFFLNQLDGFEQNTGILTIATTNHPERLDPAIANRPSRFDRKYHFVLPAPAERSAYVAYLNARLADELRITPSDEKTIAARTKKFSFAYLKELFVSSMVRWMAESGKQPMMAILLEQVVLLRSQMSESAMVEADDEREDGSEREPS